MDDMEGTQASNLEREDFLDLKRSGCVCVYVYVYVYVYLYVCVCGSIKSLQI